LAEGGAKQGEKFTRKRGACPNTMAMKISVVRRRKEARATAPNLF
jgi:hypothetical protein